MVFINFIHFTFLFLHISFLVKQIFLNMKILFHSQVFISQMNDQSKDEVAKAVT